MDGLGPGIKKYGVYRKLKTSKKKFFILREPTDSPACLEYYDSEKKCKPGTKPKRTINLNSCFSINAKQDAKHDHVIVLFTRDDCLGIVFDTKEEQTEWLDIMLTLQQESGAPKMSYDHVWQATVKPEGLANGKYLSSGIYRLCLSKKSLCFIRLNKEDPDIDFQLATIRRCGHTKTYFFIESGNAAVTGAGELWMQVEDSVIAHHMHDTLLKAMKAQGRDGDVKPMPTIRGRSHTMDKTNKPSSQANSMKRNMSVGESSTLPRRLKAKSMHVSSTSEMPSSPGRVRHSQSPNKPMSSHIVRPKSSFVSSAFSMSPSNSPSTSSPLSTEIRGRADSMESRGSRRTDASSVSDDIDVEQAASGVGMTHSTTLESKDYLSMVTFPKDITVSLSPDHGTGHEGYMEMNSPVGQQSSPLSKSLSTEPDQYMQMSPGQSVIEGGFLHRSGTSPCMSTASSGIGTEDSSYLDMSAIGSTLQDVKAKLDGGYLYMHAGSGSLPKYSSDGLRPDKVPSLLSDTESVDDFPKRAYSVGSKPVPIQPGLSESYAYMDMACSAEAIEKGKHKASSAPLLVDEVSERGSRPGLLSSPHHVASRSNSRSTTPRSTTPSQILECDHQDLLMEMDFQTNKSSGSHESLSESRSRTSSFGSKDFRSRTSSGGSKDFHSRTSSFGTDFRDRTDSIDSMSKRASYDPFRTRTQTVCQDSLRPRTSSFGPADMRPRSSSHGNSRFKELSRRVKEKALQHRFLDQSKSKKKHTSKESIASQQSSHGSAVELSESEYIDIEVKKPEKTSDKHSASKHRKLKDTAHGKKTALPEEEYMVIKPIHMSSDPDPISQQLKATKHVHMSPKIETIIDHPKSSSPHVKKSSQNRREYTSGHAFKHSSSSESISSTSSSDFSTKGRSRKTSPQSLPSPSMGDYFEVVPQTSPRYSQGSSKLIRHNSKPDVIEDSYLVYAPKSGNTSDCSSSYGSLEKVTSPISEESHTTTFLGLEKIVSPIREEDNEAIFGPKPKALTKDKTALLKSLKHEYVNVKFEGDQTETKNSSDSEDVNRTEVRPGVECVDIFNIIPKDKKPEKTNPPTSLSIDKISVEEISNNKNKDTDQRFQDKSFSRVQHDYCEISFGTGDSVKQDKGLPIKLDSKLLDEKNENDGHYHEMSYPELKETVNKSNRLRSKSNLVKVTKPGFDNKSSNSPTTAEELNDQSGLSKPPFDILENTAYPKEDSGIKLSPKVPESSTATIDVFNLGAKPCSSPVEIKTNRKLSSSPSSDGSASSQTSAVCLSQDIHRKLSHGSVASLTSLDSHSTKGRPHEGIPFQNSMSNPGDRRSYQEHVNTSTGNGDSMSLCSRQLSRTSLSSMDSQGQMLNYATLDLSASLEEGGFSVLTSSQVSPGVKPMHSSDDNAHPISYAQIDFEKSEQMKAVSSVTPSKVLTSKTEEES